MGNDVVLARRAFLGGAAALLLAGAPLARAAEGRVVAVFGDSLADGLWAGLQGGVAQEAGLRLVRLGTVGNGLTRAGWRDWVTGKAAEARAKGADSAIVMLGANDVQGLRDDQRRTWALASEGWDREYGARAEFVIGAFREAGCASVAWVGLPVMRDAEAERAARHCDEVDAAAAARAGARFVDISKEFRAADGRWTASVPSGPHKGAALRAEDGVHFSGLGYRLMAEAAWRGLSA
jgi:hypothetical protein